MGLSKFLDALSVAAQKRSFKLNGGQIRSQNGQCLCPLEAAAGTGSGTYREAGRALGLSEVEINIVVAGADKAAGLTWEAREARKQMLQTVGLER